MKRVLVISPHPDDEAIGCGGSVCRHVHEGEVVHVIFLTSGEKGVKGKDEIDVKLIRENEANIAAEILQTSQSDFWREPDGNFSVNKKNTERLVEKIKLFQPEIIYVPHEHEQHPDHVAAARLVREALKEMNEKPTVWMYEVWTPIHQIDAVVDISDFVEIKRKAIRAHRSQCDIMKFDEAILALNRYRGEMHSWPGGDYAEVFEQMKFENA